MSMNLIRIKNVNMRDLNKIFFLEKEVFKQNAFPKELIKRLIHRGTLFLKLEFRNFRKRIIGFIIIIKDDEDRFNLINFLIDPEFQGKGYGSYLLGETIMRIKNSSNIKKIVLNVQVNNLIAIKLYQKFNFQLSPYKINNYYPTGEDAYSMELNL